MSEQVDPRADGRATDGEVPTWEQVVERHSDRVYRLAYRLTGDRHDAEDLTQEVFVRVFRSLDSYTPGTFEGWLHRITTNLFLDQARRRQRIRFDALSDERAGRLTSNAPTPDAAYADRTFDDDVEAALATLPPDFRAAVVLCDVEGLSYDEIAEILGEMTRLAESEGVQLLVENEGSCNVCHSRELAALCQLVPSRAFGINWDPVNEMNRQGKPFPEGYALLPKDRLHNVQMKARALVIGPDFLDWAAIFRALEADNYQGPVGLETHVFDGTLIEKSHLCMAKLKELLA